MVGFGWVSVVASVVDGEDGRGKISGARLDDSVHRLEGDGGHNG